MCLSVQAADCLCLGMVLQLLLPWVRSGLGTLPYWLAVGTVLGVVPMAMALMYERAVEQSCAAAEVAAGRRHCCVD